MHKISQPDDLKSLEEMFELLAADAEYLRERVAQSDSAEARRSFVRSVFALIEGIVFAIKRCALAGNSVQVARLSAAERALLQEEFYDLTDDGDAKTRPAFLHLAKNLRFAFKLFARCYEADHDLSPDEVGWAAFRRSARVRNRLMHPKNASDLEVTDAELADATRVMNWFAAHVILLFVATVRGLTRIVESLAPGSSKRVLTEEALESMSRSAFPHVRMPPRTT